MKNKICWERNKMATGDPHIQRGRETKKWEQWFLKSSFGESSLF